MIEVQQLTKYYGQTKAIEDVTFQVGKGEILGFLGPNAAGKTTTMRIITGYMPATEGTARVAGFDVFEHPLEVKRRIGYLPENPPLYTDMTVRSYLDFVARIKGVDGKRRTLKVEEVMERTSTMDVAKTLIGRLSKGYRQRVGIAQALIHEPEVLILDEPTLGLDPKQIIEVRELIKLLGGEHTIILSTHILPEVSMTCERLIVINRGRVVAEGKPEELAAQLRRGEGERVVLEVEGPREEVERTLRAIEGITAVHCDRPGGTGCWTFTVEAAPRKAVRREIAAAIVGKRWGLHELRSVGMSLEEIYLQIIAGEEVA